MARQPRGEQARTRALDVAITILVESGYTALTTRAVQEAAGWTRGAFLHHFPTREHLLAATAEEALERRSERVRRIITAFNADPPPDRLPAAIRTVRELFSGHDFLAEVELWTASRTNPALAQTLLPVIARLNVRLPEQLGELFGPELSAHPDFPLIGMLTVQVATGLALTVPFIGDQADGALLEYWCRAAEKMLGS